MNAADGPMRTLLERARVIGVAGLSDKPERDSNEVARYLQSQGYQIVPINPMVQEVLGERSYPSVSAVPFELHLDILDIFRRSDQVLPIVEEGLARGVGAIWMQLGVESTESVRKAEAANVPVYQNLCIMVQHRRLHIPPRTGGP
ncbi:MAG TPA: CoA-binding protein [Thermoplasmata archaeon]|nr:CoA-binding protein [Thermoplasmata archaeon]